MSSSGPSGTSNGDGSLPGQAAGRGRTLDPAALIGRLWQQSLPLIRTRVHRLEHLAQEGFEDGSFSDAARTEAADIAHKLAGSLGMFGYPRGTDLAREMEQVLESDLALDREHFLRLSRELRAHLAL